METPVLIIIFNREQQTHTLISSLKKIKPNRVYISADGPRECVSSDKLKCKKTRELLRLIDWPCDVFKNFSEKNLGCKRNVIQAINWFFSNEEQGIILEDDCIPNKSFFKFCEAMLQKYRHDSEIFQVSGNNYLKDKSSTLHSYYFTTIPDIWGWATWKRAWQHFDEHMSTYLPLKKSGKIHDYYRNKEIAKWAISYMDDVYYNRSNIWSPIWVYTRIKANSISIAPSKNLIKNIGFQERSTSGSYKSFSYYDCFPTAVMDTTRLVSPPEKVINYQADAERFKAIKKTDPRLFFKNKVKEKLKRILPYY